MSHPIQTGGAPSLGQWCRGFVEREILAHAEQWESDGEIPRELHVVAGKVRLRGVGYCMWEAMMCPGAPLRSPRDVAIGGRRARMQR